VVGDVYLPWDVCLVGQHLRVDNWDGWESSKRRNSEASGGEIKDEEVAKGKRCTGELVAYLNDWQLQVKPGIRSRDNYGRLLGPWRFVNGSRVQDAKEVAIRKGWIRQ
jgi:endonuclease YncB( thermonuclease family)